MTKKEFKQALIERLRNKGLSELNTAAIESALGKTSRHMINTIGHIEWDDYQLGNAECYYNEYGKGVTFNQAMYRGRKTGTSRY